MQVERGKILLASALSSAELTVGQLPWDSVFRVLDDCLPAAADQIPDTGE